jgi:uncharacterized protein (DUF1684 family)
VVSDYLTLLDWKRTIFELYAAIRVEPRPEQAWERWRAVRDNLFVEHPQSPLDDARRRDFAGLDLYAYDTAFRTLAIVEPAPAHRLAIVASGGEPITFTRFGTACFELLGAAQRLDLYWLEGYGGGVFLPFLDETSADATYGGGRYLLDTVKGADLGESEGRLVLDFNFAYNPSCSYDNRWVCPLAPTENRLEVGVRAGERHLHV